MRKRILLVFWLLGILFPMAWLGKFSAGYRVIFDGIFSPEWIHWVMHATLYAGLSILLIWAFNLPSTWRNLGIIWLIVLFVGIIQEGLQILSGVQVLRWNTFFDLGVDSLGTLIGFGVITVFHKFSRS